MVIRDAPLRNMPATVELLTDRVARVRATELHHVRPRLIVIIGLEPDAAGIDDKPSTRDRENTWYVGMPAQDERVLDPLGVGFDRGLPCEFAAITIDLFEEVLRSLVGVP